MVMFYSPLHGFLKMHSNIFMMLYNYITNNCTNAGHFMAVDQVSIIHIINSCKLQYICSCNMYFCAFSEGDFKNPLESLPTPFVSLGFVPRQCLGYVPHSNGLLHTLYTAFSTVHTSTTLLTEISHDGCICIPVSTDCRQVSAMPDDHPLILGVGLEINNLCWETWH